MSADVFRKMSILSPSNPPRHDYLAVITAIFSLLKMALLSATISEVFFKFPRIGGGGTQNIGFTK
jgi:hypothetical protein